MHTLKTFFARLWLADYVFAVSLLLHALGLGWAYLIASIPLGVLFTLLAVLTVTLYLEYLHAFPPPQPHDPLPPSIPFSS